MKKKETLFISNTGASAQLSQLTSWRVEKRGHWLIGLVCNAQSSLDKSSILFPILALCFYRWLVRVRQKTSVQAISGLVHRPKSTFFQCRFSGSTSSEPPKMWSNLNFDSIIVVVKFSLEHCRCS